MFEFSPDTASDSGDLYISNHSVITLARCVHIISAVNYVLSAKLIAKSVCLLLSSNLRLSRASLSDSDPYRSSNNVSDVSSKTSSFTDNKNLSNRAFIIVTSLLAILYASL